MGKVEFGPRRLGHVNLWVSDLERSVDFYESICGIELVRRERDILIAFHSNGNTHHDIGMVEISRGKDRYGRDGLLQIPKTRGLNVGLNHLGWEMTSEVDLVDAIRRARDCSVSFARTLDHVISHSAYLNDPDGNGHEFYADQMRDWERIYNLQNEDEVTADWDPMATPPSSAHNYNQSFRVRHVERALLHPSHLSGVRLSTRKFEPMYEFLRFVAGLRKIGESGSHPHREVRVGGTLGRADITLAEVGDDEPVGLSGIRLKLAAQQDLVAVAAQLNARGYPAFVREEELALTDPDGFRIEFHHHES